MAATIDDRVAELERANAQLRRQLDACSAELKEARDQQTATAEVLQVINSSPGDLAPVFDTTLEKALRLCDAAFGILFIRDGELFRAAATLGLPAPLEDFMRNPFKPDQVPLIAGAIQQGQVLHVHDLADSDGYRQRMPSRVAGVELGGVRTVLYVPLIKDGRVLGVFVIYRQEVRPFSDKQIALAQNFAAQAIIAMENARLLTEMREALEQQTATAEVLGVINSSPGDLAPVFDAMLDKALRLCDAAFGLLHTYDGERFRALAISGVSDATAEAMREWIPDPGSALERIARGDRVVHIPDVIDTEAYRSGIASRLRLVELTGARTALWVALSKDDAPVGVFVIYRKEVRPFTDKQIALVQNFAAQAVIAMENARLITETREALEQQTATAEVLQVINSSPGDLAPVFDAMLEKALHLCGAPYGILWNYDGEFFEVAAQRGVPKAFLDTMSGPQRPTSPETTRGRLVAGEHVVHITNLGADLLYQSGDQHRRALVDAAGAQVVVAVSLRKDDKLLGAFTIYRQEARPFTDKQIALVTTFADQAVIAMENARLLTETREALEQQTATAEVLQVINSSPGDLTPVFDAMLDRAMRLCGVDHAALELYDGEQMHAVAVHGASGKFSEMLRQGYPATESPASRTLLEGGSFVEIADAAEIDHVAFRTAAAVDGIRTVLFVPLQRDDVFLGMIGSARREVRPFSEKEIALLQNFAAQAVIAMENARLITETREALEQQTATAEVLQVINSSPGDLAPVFDAMLEKATNLCEAQTGVLWTYHGEEMQPAAILGAAPGYEEYLRQGLRPLSPNHAHLSHGAALVHIPDIPADPVYAASELARALVELGGVRTILMVPMRKDSATLGAFCIYRKEPRPFTDKQIALLQNFAAQAVIAMENARLLTETREALEQQTATAEVLQVINSSPGDLAPVFDAILEKAHSLCEIAQGSLELYDGERFRAVAVRGLSDEFTEMLRQGSPASDNPATRPLIEGERFSYIADMAASDYPVERAAAATEGVRTLLCVPLRREGQLLGMIASARKEMRPFSEKEIALLENFAAQAVIAMENARLITETREALERQTATAEVLQVINSSPGDLVPVFDAMLERAMRLCGGSFGVFVTYEGEHYRVAANRGLPPGLAEFVRDPIPIEPGSMPERLRRGEDTIQIPDIAALGSEHRTPGLAAMIELGKARTALWVGLRKDGVPQGFFGIYRQEVRPFTDKEIALLQNFAAQAVIAMENARLITETREALEQQTATAEVLGVINSSPGDLAPVFEVNPGKGAQPMWRRARQPGALRRPEIPRGCDARISGQLRRSIAARVSGFRQSGDAAVDGGPGFHPYPRSNAARIPVRAQRGRSPNSRHVAVRSAATRR